MNFYQRLGVFLTRIIGLFVAIIGAMGLFDYLVGRVQGSPNPSERLGAAFTWTAVGVVVFALGKPLGRLLGGGLGEEKAVNQSHAMS